MGMVSKGIKRAFPSLRILATGYTEIRSLPKNIREEDIYLFINELVYQYGNITAVEWSNCTLYGSEIVPAYLVFPILFSFKHVSLSRIAVKLFLKRLYSYLQAFILLRYQPNRSKIDSVVYIHDTYSAGFFHWCCDCLPKLVAGKSLFQEGDTLLMIPNSYKSLPYVEYTLNTLDINYRFGNANEIVQARKLYAINPIAHSGNYKSEIMRFIRDKLSRSDINTVSERKIYVSRKYSHRRKLKNEEILVDYLLAMDFTIIYPEETCFCEQVKLFSNCSLLISLHGGGLTNMIFMREHSSVIEIRLENDTHNNCYFALACSLGVNYYYVEAKSTNDSRIVQNTNLELRFSEIERVLSMVARV